MKTTFGALLLLASSVQAVNPIDLLGDAAGPKLNLSYDSAKSKLKIEFTQTSALLSSGLLWGQSTTEEMLLIMSVAGISIVSTTKNSVATTPDPFYTD
jgi:hypothetical protein